MGTSPSESNLQLEILSLLAFHDQEGLQVRAQVDLSLFDQKPIQRLAKDIYQFFDNYGAAPKDNLADIFAPYLASDQKEIYNHIWSRLTRQREGLSPAYILSKLNSFLSEKILSKGIEEAFRNLEKGDFEKARQVMNEASKKSVSFTDLGLDIAKSPEIIYSVPNEMEFTTGVEVLDKGDFYPARGEFMLILGMFGTGKTWALINVGASNLKRGKKILHISLEMGVRKVALRYVMNLYKLTKDLGKTLNVPKLTMNPITHEYTFFSSPDTFHGIWDPKTRKELESRLSTKANRLIIKDFPPRVLTIPALEAYIEALEQHQDFMPDMLIVDYPDLFKFDNHKDLRLEIGEVTMQLRRIAIEHGIAVVAVSQGNRSGVNKILGGEHLSEDFSKAFHADRIASFNRTEDEKLKGIANIHIVKNRDGEESSGALICQSLEIGQFSVSSVEFHSDAYQRFMSSFGQAGD